jgi:hypothetical protein
MLLAGLWLAAGAAVPAPARAQGQDSSEALIRQYPAVLVYRGLARHAAGDRLGAVAEWERYVALAPSAADRAAVGRLAEEAFVAEFPMARYYQGLFLSLRGDHAAAIAAWRRYLATGLPTAEWQRVHRLIAQAQDEQRRVLAASRR